MADNAPAPNQSQQQPNPNPPPPSEKPAKSGLLALADDLYGASKPPEPPKQEAKPEGSDQPKEPEPGQGSPKQAEGDVEEVELSSLAQLPDLVKQVNPDIDLSLDTLMALKVPTKVNGKQSEISIADAIKAVQIGQATEEELANAKTKAGQIVAEAVQQKQQLEASVAVVSKMLQDMEGDLNADLKDTNWSKLKEDDPALYAVRKEEMRERREKIEAKKRDVAQAYGQVLQQQQQQQQLGLAQYIQAEKAKLIEAIPEMADEEKSKALKTKLAEHLLSRGFSREEIAKAYDSRLIVMAHEAMQFREAKQKAAAVKKKVIKIPKVIKPGTSQPQKPNGVAKKDDPVSILYPN